MSAKSPVYHSSSWTGLGNAANQTSGVITTDSAWWGAPPTSSHYDPYQLLAEITRLQTELQRARAGLTSDKFDHVHDADLVLELIARGYVVHKPLPEDGNGETAEGDTATTAP